MDPKDNPNPNADLDTPKDTPTEPESPPEPTPEPAPTPAPTEKVEPTEAELGPKPEPKDQKRDEDIFFEIPTQDGTRRVTAADWKKLQGQLTKINQERAQTEESHQREMQKNKDVIGLFQQHFPEEYRKLTGLAMRDPEIIGTLPPEVQAQIIVAKEKEDQEVAAAREAQMEQIKVRQKEINDSLDRMKADPKSFPDYDEEAVCTYAIEHGIPDPEVAYRAWHYSRLQSSTEAMIEEARKQAVIDFQKQVYDNKAVIAPTGPAGDKPTEEPSGPSKSARERLRERAKQLKPSLRI